MNKNQTKKLFMYKRVCALLQENQDLWASIPKFTGLVEDLNSSLDAYVLNMQEQSKKAVGVGQLKITQRNEMISRLLICQKTLKVFASDKFDVLLKERNKKSTYEIRRMSDVSLLIFATNIREDLSIYASYLASGYGLKLEFQQEAMLLIDQLEAVISSTRKAINARKTSTKLLAQLEKHMDVILQHEFDELIYGFKLIHSAFYQNYIDARRIARTKARDTERDDGIV